MYLLKSDIDNLTNIQNNSRYLLHFTAYLAMFLFFCLLNNGPTQVPQLVLISCQNDIFLLDNFICYCLNISVSKIKTVSLELQLWVAKYLPTGHLHLTALQRLQIQDVLSETSLQVFHLHLLCCSLAEYYHPQTAYA